MLRCAATWPTPRGGSVRACRTGRRRPALLPERSRHDGRGLPSGPAAAKVWRKSQATMTEGNSMPLLGCVADDFTGATDLASMLVQHGMRTVQVIGVPGEDDAIPDAD